MIKNWLLQKKRNLFVWSGVLCFLLLLHSCSKNQADEIKPVTEPVIELPGGTTVTADNVTFTNFMKGLVESNCSSCHGVGRGQGGFTYSGYSSLVTNESIIKNQVLVLKVMPKGGSLSATQLALVKAWFDRGMPQ